MSYVPTYRAKYDNEIKDVLVKQFNYTSVMQVPKLEKIVINQGISEAITGSDWIDPARSICV